MEIGERFNEILGHFNLNANSFAKRMGVTHTTVRNILGKTNKPGYDLLNKVIRTFPEISAEWLLTGDGRMLKSDTGINLNEPLEPYGKSVREVLREKDDRIEELKELLKLKSKIKGD